MLFWAVVFLAIGCVAGFFSFGGIGSASAGIAQIVCILFFALALAAVVIRAVRRNKGSR